MQRIFNDKNKIHKTRNENTNTKLTYINFPRTSKLLSRVRCLHVSGIVHVLKFVSIWRGEGRVGRIDFISIFLAYQPVLTAGPVSYALLETFFL